jgi:HAD superfamily hydrolase (TIGR01509 family)
VTRAPDRVVVFDLGGVLAEFGGVERMRQLSGFDTDEEMWRRWLTCEWVRRFERGQCSAEDFAAGVVADWQLALSPGAFLDEFTSWLVGELPGARDLVAETRRRATVACLSNTNRVHWEAGAETWPLLSSFDRAFLSFEMGLVKPDRDVFDHVVAELDVPAEAVIFLDDNTLNVEAATEVGITSRRVVGVAEARDALVELGVLP